MRKLFSTLQDWIANLFNTFGHNQPVIKAKPERKRRRKNTKRERGGFGEYYTIKELLEDLDKTFDDIKKMTPRRNSHAQRLVKKYGPHIIGMEDSNDKIAFSRLESFRAYGYPAFLINYHNSDRSDTSGLNEGDGWCDQFFVATKLTKIPMFLKKKGHVYYEVTGVTYDGGKKMKEPHEYTFTIDINKDTGDVRAMPSELPQEHIIPSKTRGVRSNRYTSFHWRYPDLEDDSHKDADRTPAGLKKYLEGSFCLTYNLTMRREYNVNVIVKKGKRRATFSVPIHQWKYFFKDRIKAKTKNGNTKPIFHWVSAHVRHAKTGDQNVKTHMRGVRHFWWSGYEIRITLPGRHSVSQASFDVSSIVVDDDKVSDDMIDITAGDHNTLIDLFDGTKTKKSALH